MSATTLGATRLDVHMPASDHGNVTRIEIAAEPAEVWAALRSLRLDDCRLTQVLMSLRALPGLVTRGGALGRRTRASGTDTRPLIEAMLADRFLLLDEIPGEEIVIGVIGQFWRPDGGTDAEVRDASEFAAFDEPGFVKVAMNFRVEGIGTATTVLSTETRCRATDPVAARRFARYWALIGWGSKAIRWDFLTATRRAATRAR